MSDDDKRASYLSAGPINPETLAGQLGGRAICTSHPNGIDGGDVLIVEAVAGTITAAELEAACKAHVWTPMGTARGQVAAMIDDASTLDELKTAVKAVLGG